MGYSAPCRQPDETPLVALTVAEQAHRLAAKPTAAIGLLKRVVDEGFGLPVEEALRREENSVRALTRTADAAEGLQAFLDKRAAVFSGR